MKLRRKLGTSLCGLIALPALSFIPQCGGGAAVNCNIEVSRPYIAAGTRGPWAPENMGGRSFAQWWTICRTRLHTIKVDPRVPNGSYRVGIIVNANNCTYDSPWINLGNLNVWKRADLVVIAN